MTNSLAIYYGLHVMLHDVKEKKNGFENVPDDIFKTVKETFDKNYYCFIERSDIYYIASSLDP